LSFDLLELMAMRPSKAKPSRIFLRFSREVYYRAWEALATAANPLGLVLELRSKNWNVVLIDMGGVEQDGLDISHTVACEILQVPCNNGMVEGVLEQVRANQNKRRDPNITT
jgi:hypothetical protein